MSLGPLPALCEDIDPTRGLLKLSLSEAANIAIENSHKLAMQIETAASAREAARAAGSRRFPQISLQGSAQFVSKIGAVQLPTGQNMRVGDHRSWAVGPVLDWVAWDAGAIAKHAKSMRYGATAQNFSSEAERRTVLLNARMAYFSVQLALEQLRLIASSLDVARSQYKDVSIRHNTGTASRLDLVAAHQEVALRERDYLDAEQELAMQVRNLVSLLDLKQVPTASYPADAKLARTFKSPPMEPDLVLDIDGIAQSIGAMRHMSEGIVEIAKHPAVESAKWQTDSQMLAYESVRARHWPTVNVQGKSTYEYPNFGELSTVQQNRLSFGLNLPVIDWGMISKEARSERHKAFAAREQMRETVTELEKALGQTKDSIALFTRARVSSAQAADDAVEAAGLTYDEYLAGHVIFLEVQRANNMALAAKVEAARNDVKLLGWLAQMESLITAGGDER